MFSTVKYTLHISAWDGILDLQNNTSRLGVLAFTFYQLQILKIYFVVCMVLRLLKNFIL